MSTMGDLRTTEICLGMPEFMRWYRWLTIIKTFNF